MAGPLETTSHYNQSHSKITMTRNTVPYYTVIALVPTQK